jgi:non-homologous end joining protein Ku
MTDRGVVALVKFSLRGPARFGLLTNAGDLLEIKSADQVRQALPLELDTIDPAEMNLAISLIDAVGISEPVLVDDTAIKVKELIEQKAAGLPTTAMLAAPPAVIDLMASLNASISAAKAARLPAPSGAPVQGPS